MCYGRSVLCIPCLTSVSLCWISKFVCLVILSRLTRIVLQGYLLLPVLDAEGGKVIAMNPLNGRSTLACSLEIPSTWKTRNLRLALPVLCNQVVSNSLTAISPYLSLSFLPTDGRARACYVNVMFALSLMLIIWRFGVCSLENCVEYVQM